MRISKWWSLATGATLVAVTLVGCGPRQAPDASSEATAASMPPDLSGPGMPVFELDPSWPAPFPYNWIIGHVPGVATDASDHVFLLTRPNTLDPEDRARAAPPVMELDETGHFVNGWGGPGVPGFDWPDSEHGLAVDYKGNVWIGGSAPVAPSLFRRNDDMLIKFSHDGTFILQIGGRDTSPTSQDPPVVGGNKAQDSVHQSADAFVYEPTNELYVADGYGNRRVAVFDADTAAFKRAWGAFGNEPIDVLPAVRVVGEAGAGAGRGRGAAPALDTEGPGAPQFGSPVHSVKVSHDGLVYVADRSNRRVQVFQTDGTYVDQLFVNRAGPSGGSVAGIVLSPDAEQRFMYLADYGNSHIVVVDRKALQVLYQFGQRSAAPGDFQGLHHLAIDSKGNLYTGEVAPGARAQKFLFTGMSPTRPANALTDEQLMGQPAR